jgi:hypothetical protein
MAATGGGRNGRGKVPSKAATTDLVALANLRLPFTCKQRWCCSMCKVALQTIRVTKNWDLTLTSRPSHGGGELVVRPSRRPGCGSPAESAVVVGHGCGGGVAAYVESWGILLPAAGPGLLIVAVQPAVGGLSTLG